MSGGLISPGTLAARLQDGSVDVLDLRSGPGGAGRAAFEAGHIPGARHSDYAADGWRANIGGAPGKLPPDAHLSALIGRLGLEPDRAIVLVPAGQNVSDLAAAARVFWTLRQVGYRPVALLDGGFPAWVEAGLPLEAGAPPAGSAAARLRHVAGLRAEAPDVLAVLGAGRAALIDGRAPGYFNGAEKAPEALAAGHIPGAVNIDYVTAYDAAANRLRPRAELEALFAAIPAGTPVISYCNTGHTAALNWFVLSEVLERPDVRLYDGSMTDWTQDPSRPVAR